MIWELIDDIVKYMENFCKYLEELANVEEKGNDPYKNLKIGALIGHCMELSQKKDGGFFFYNSLQNQVEEIREKIRLERKSDNKLSAPEIVVEEWIRLEKLVFNLRMIRYNLRKGNFNRLIETDNSLKDLYAKFGLSEKALRCNEQSLKVLDNLGLLEEEFKSLKKDVQAYLNPKYKDKGLKLSSYD